MIANVLTLNPIKHRVYQCDVHFTAALGTAREVWPDERGLSAFLWNHAALLLRPEAILARRSRSLFPVLRAHGLIPVAVRRIRIMGEQAGLLWRYQANVMTPAHCLLLQRLLAAGPSIYVILKDYSERKSTPATGHLTYLKGPTLMTRRRPLHLRSLAGPAVANILSYLHVADDPADFLRELATLFPTSLFLELLREAAAGQDRTGAALAALEAAELGAPRDLLLGGAGGLSGSGYGYGCEENLRGSPEDMLVRRNWTEILSCAPANISYVSGEVYDTRAAWVPDDKKYLARLDSHLLRAALGRGF
jgi:hypothetical protein